MKYSSLLLGAILLLESPAVWAADQMETFDIVAPQNDQVQPAPAYPIPITAEPDKVDTLAVQVDALTQRIKTLEQKLETCGCGK